MLSSTTHMSPLLAVLLVWLIGLPIGFWIFAVVYPVRARRLLRRTADSGGAMPLIPPVTVTELSGHSAETQLRETHELT